MYCRAFNQDQVSFMSWKCRDLRVFIGTAVFVFGLALTSCASDTTEDTSSDSHEVSQANNPSPTAPVNANEDMPTPSSTIDQKSSPAPSNLTSTTLVP